jgi:phospholipid/cholesterol/gamma-HCH transport system substrate-binding protein
MNEKLVITAPRRFRGIRKQISVFLLTAFVGFAALITLIAYKQGMFVQHTHIYFNAPDASGLNKGMSVRLYGVPVGQVKDIEFAERGGVRVRLGINRDYIPRVPQGSQARLAREGVVGAASIQIVTAGALPSRVPVSEGEDIKYIPHRTMNEMMDEVRAQMTPAFQELRKAAAELTNPDSDFRKSASSVNEVLNQMPALQRELRQLLRDTDATVLALGKSSAAVARQAETTLAVFERLGTQTGEQVPVIAGKLATTLDSLNATALQVRETTRANGEALRELLATAPDLVRGSGELVRDSQEIAAAARRTWLLRDYIEPTQMRTLPVDSFESFGKR